MSGNKKQKKMEEKRGREGGEGKEGRKEGEGKEGRKEGMEGGREKGRKRSPLTLTSQWLKQPG